MPKMVILRGLPGSGKSTLSRQFVERGYKRFNKDDLRNMIDAGEYNAENEYFIHRVQHAMIELALRDGTPVVVDNTHGRDKTVNDLLKLAEVYGYATEIAVLDTPIETCIWRDRMRRESIGEKAIRSMAEMPFFKELYK